MSIFTNIKARVKNARLKTKVIAAGLTVAIASVATIAAMGTAGAAPSSFPDCSANSVIPGGASGVSVLQKDYKNGASCVDSGVTYSQPAYSIQDIYHAFGISSSDVAAMSSDAVSGYVTRNGDVYVGTEANHTLVATDAYTAGRTLLYRDGKPIPGQTSHTYGHTHFYERAPSVSFENDALSAMVIMQNGVFQHAMLNSCGNPVNAVPKKPNYSILKQVRLGMSGNYSSNITNVKSGSTVEYKITVSSTGEVPVKNVVVSDNKPSDIVYRSGTLEENGTPVTGADEANFFTTGITLPSITNGSQDVFTFEAQAGKVSDTSPSCVAETLNNVGTITTIVLGKKQSGAGVGIVCTPPQVSLSCVNLTAVGATPNPATGDQQYTLTVTSAEKNLKITGYGFDFNGNGTTTTLPSTSTTFTTTHTYAPGTYKPSVTVYAVSPDTGMAYHATAPACARAITVKPVVSSLACDLLTALPGTVTNPTTGAQDYTFTGQATATNAKITNYTFTVTNTDTKAVVTTIPLSSGATSVTTTAQTFTPGNYSVTVTVKGTDNAGNPITAPVSVPCTTTFSIKAPQCVPGVPTPQCSVPSIACVSVSDTPGAIDTTTGAQAFTFTGQATAQDATITNYTFTITDTSTGKVVTTIPMNTGVSPVTTPSQTITPGSYSVALTVQGKDNTGKPITAVVNPDCTKTFSVLPAQCAPGVPAGSSSCYTYTCNSFTLTIDNATQTATVATFNATSTNPAAVLSNISINWGDGTNSTGANVGAIAPHTFTVSGSTVTATGQFTVPGQTTPVSSTTCVQPVSFTTTPPPAQLPNTGAGDVIGIFVGAIVAGTIGGRLLLGRKLARR